jgi:type VI secretion system protein ImpK
MPDSDDPFLPADSLQRPRPGAGRRGMPEPPPAARSAAASRVVDAEPLSASARSLLGIGLNPLVQAASPLLLLAGQVRGASSLQVSTLRRHALDEVRQFEEQARSAGVRNEIVLAARYALCAALDEAVLSSPSGAQSEWAEHPLLVALHREAWGGEKFFEMLDRISGDPARHIDLMELQYLLLALGFSGKYQMQDRGHEQLADLQHELYRKIRGHRGQPPPELSLEWRGLVDQRNRLIRYVPWWVVGAAAAAILTVAFAVYYARLATLAEPIEARLDQVGGEDFTAPPPPRMPGPTLKQLLAPQEAEGKLTVDENGGRSVVTLLGEDMFASARADLNPSYEDTLHVIAAALNRVPGRVQVVGHTDSQPISSHARFGNNVELSRERALTVVNILKPIIDNPGRLSWRGAGDTQPITNDPAQRARNRRVEIVHIAT